MKTAISKKHCIIQTLSIIFLMASAFISNAATISGTVVIEGRADYSGVTVSIEGTSYTAATDVSGAYSISNDKEIEIRNDGGALMDWKITWPETDTWLNVSPSEGGGGSWLVDVTVDRTKLPAGAGPHESKLTVTADSLSKEISISVEVSEEPITEDVIVGKDGAEMVLIPAGDFMMGTSDAEKQALINQGMWRDDLMSGELPEHPVYLDGFYIDKYEVTNEQYAEFLNDYGKNQDSEGHQLLDLGSSDCRIEKAGGVYRPKSGYEKHPVVYVSWYGAVTYAEYYGKRLPTEAEWEKAARGGLVGKRYPWGDEDPDPGKANYDWNVGDTKPVGTYPPNDYKLYDMAGNVWEWCNDWYDGNYYSNSPYRNPPGSSSGQYRVVRGGSWFSVSYFVRTALRRGLGLVPNYAGRGLGFRCCVSQDITP